MADGLQEQHYMDKKEEEVGSIPALKLQMVYKGSVTWTRRRRRSAPSLPWNGRWPTRAALYGQEGGGSRLYPCPGMADGLRGQHYMDKKEEEEEEEEQEEFTVSIQPATGYEDKSVMVSGLFDNGQLTDGAHQHNRRDC